MSWSNIQFGEIEKYNQILKIKCQTISYTRIGGYNSSPYSQTLDILEKIRPSEIKGVWRWWARVILGTVLWNKNYEVDYQILDKIISDLFGSEDSSSKLLLKVNIVSSFEKIKKEDVESFAKNLKTQMGISSRIDLLSLKSKVKKDIKELLIEPGLEFELIVTTTSDLSEEEASFAKYSLILSLLFSGIGSMLSRGFGKVKVLNINDKEIEKILNEIYSGKTKDEVKKGIENLISQALESAAKYFEKNVEGNEKLMRDLRERKSKIPNIPLLDQSSFRFEVVKIYRKNIHLDQILFCILSSTMKIEWKSIAKTKTMFHQLKQKEQKDEVKREKGHLYHTWILGLPRKGQDKRGQDTGYISDINRYPSSISFTLVKLNNDDYVIILFGFLTQALSEIVYSENLQFFGGIQEDVASIIRKYGAMKSTGKTAENPSVSDIFDIGWKFLIDIINNCP